MAKVANQHLLFIDGEWVGSSSGEEFTTLNPATNEPLGSVAKATGDDVDAAVSAARRALESKEWAHLDPSERGRILFQIAGRLRDRQEELVLLESQDNGKTLRESRSDIAYTIRTWEYFAGLADKIEGKTVPVPGLRFDYTRWEPLGVTAHIVPWNYPLVLGCRGMAPALAAGNTVVVKPSSSAPLTTLALAEVASEAGLPRGVLNVVTGSGSETGSHLASHKDVDSITFTGSRDAGVEVMKRAAENVTPIILELGGKCPNIVLADADRERALRGVLRGIFTNAGQMCWAGSRLLVEESIQEDFMESLKGAARSMVLGPGTEEGSQMGPVISEGQLDRVLNYVEVGVEEGADLVTGGQRVDTPPLSRGNFIEPTILGDVTQDMTVAQEEIFGPVLSVLTFRDLKEAIRIANHTRYGLCAGIWTKDLATAHRLAHGLEAGIVSINEYPISFPQTPFGGFKESGIGHEQGLDSVYSYCRVKNVNVNLL